MENVKLNKDQKLGIQSGFLVVGIIYLLSAIPMLLSTLFVIFGSAALSSLTSVKISTGMVPIIVMAILCIICFWRAIHFLGWRKKLDDPDIEQKVISKYGENYHFVLNLILSILFWTVGMLPVIILRCVCHAQIMSAIEDMKDINPYIPQTSQIDNDNLSTSNNILQPVEQEDVYKPEQPKEVTTNNTQTQSSNIKLNLH